MLDNENTATMDKFDNFSFDSLEAIRTRLLDLTGRNRLLNFKYGRSGFVRVIDELPDQLAQALLNDTPFMFLPIEEPRKEDLVKAGYIGLDEKGREVRLKEDPSAREWAKYKGFDINFDLPAVSASEAGKHDDNKIQSLLYPAELESKLRGIRSKANTAIEETGANILFFALGFLEWYEDERSDLAKYAPLYLIPVKIEKAKLDTESGTYRYTIEYTGEDIVPNLSLREKLKFDFALELPDLEEDMLPEAYLALVERVVLKNKPRWKIKRHATLSMFDFGKLLMYLDLDPARWPSGAANIQHHSIIKQFFSQQTEERAGSGGFSSEYAIDDLPDVHQLYPLIDDADSSQHSALVDGIKGKNLVIEGPPGSGKSQTITNLIAAAIAQGKKVLFVAEKMAALDVVKSRLEKAKLGDFCLELHSHKTQKLAVYQSISRRLAKQRSYRTPKELDLDVAMYEQKKKQLTEYAELINSKWKQTGKTIHQIFMTATRYRDEYNHVALNELQPQNINGENYDELTRRSIVDGLKRYADVYEQIRKQIGFDAGIEEHPWFGVYNAEIQHFDCIGITENLSDWQQSLFQLQASLDAVQETLSKEVIFNLDDIERLIALKDELPKLTGEENLNALKLLTRESKLALNKYIAVYDMAISEHQLLQSVLDEALLNDHHRIGLLQAALSKLDARLGNKEIKLSAAYKVLEALTELRALYTQIDEQRAIVLEQVPELEDFIPMSINGIDAFAKFVRHVADLKSQNIAKRHARFDDERLDEHLQILDQRINGAKSLAKMLDSDFEIGELPPSKQLKKAKQQIEEAGFFKWFNSDWRQAKSLVCSLAVSAKPNLKILTPLLGELVEYATLVEQINEQAEYSDLLGDSFKGVETRVDEIIELRRWYAQVRQSYGIGFGKTVTLANLLLGMPNEIFKGLQHVTETTLLPLFKEAKQKSLRLQQFNFSVFKDFDTPVFDLDNGLAVQIDFYANALKACQSQVHGDITTGELESALSKAKNYSQYKAELGRLSAILSSVFDESELPQVPQASPMLIARLKATLKVEASLAALSDQTVAGVLKKTLSEALLEQIHRQIEQVKLAYQHQQALKKSFVEAVQLDEQAWLLNTEGASKHISGLVTRNNLAIEQPNWLSTWVDFIRVRQSLTQNGLENLLLATEKQQIALVDIEGVYNYAVFDILSREIITENQSLSHFSGLNQNAIRKQFAIYDNKLKHLQQENIAYLASRVSLIDGISSGKVAGFTEMGLINNEINKKTRHVPIRQLIARAGRSLQQLKPCFMMGPHSVAQYLEPGQIEFDLVVMDEASQIKPQDSLGTIARGKQIIVVGDPKQLPPTSFFDKSVDTDDRDATAIEMSESILDVTLPMFKARRLRWHYRSRHESLIAFSNQAFYDSNLIVFPSPHNQSDEFGIKFNYVKRGRFVNQRNIEEALMVAKAVREHILHQKHESLGVVAMSAQQREQIERCVEELSKDDAVFREALEINANEDEPLFIKNLENVQGDERDVIFISCTYGPQDAGALHMPQRFGPINSAAGGRRLNVLFTRSKKRMHVFSSMKEGHILAKDGSNPGVHALKQFLAFAETKNLYQPTATGRAPDSDFEVAVASALKREGFTCVPQVGVAGYFIDLAVLDPGMPGRYLMGIECDGATYHSAKSARDRDRLRQSVLERLGWKISRIWSTDWFKNPQAQLKPIIEELHRLKTEESSTPPVSEEKEIEQIMTNADVEHKLTDDFVSYSGTLKEKLLQFAQNVIDVEINDIPEDKKLLRPAMIDALVEFRPVSKSEFQESIPNYLRKSTAPKQGKYLDQVLNIIAESEQEEFTH